MRVFGCPHCGAWVEFEDRRCLTCDTHLAYAPDRDQLVRSVRGLTCRYRSLIGCNWVADPAPEAEGGCAACRLTVERPDLTDAVAVSSLAIAEHAKRRGLRRPGHPPPPATPPPPGAGVGVAPH